MLVEFNAWLYQGYADARAALMDVIATKLEGEARTAQRLSTKLRHHCGA
jgi:predicted KAP-like P-loop ATPase